VVIDAIPDTLKCALFDMYEGSAASTAIPPSSLPRVLSHGRSDAGEAVWGVRVVPETNFNGAVQFNYTVHAANPNMPPATGAVKVQFRPVNDAPVLLSDVNATLLEHERVTLHLRAHDAENDTLVPSLRSLPSHGTLYQGDGITPITAAPAELTNLSWVVNGNSDEATWMQIAHVVYEPPADGVFLDYFEFRFSDGPYLFCFVWQEKCLFSCIHTYTYTKHTHIHTYTHTRARARGTAAVGACVGLLICVQGSSSPQSVLHI
jgi:hypothetical protein